jgi:hypothetical protein
LEKRVKTYLIPAFSLESKISHLFKNKTRSTLANSLFEHTDFQSRTESSYKQNGQQAAYAIDETCLEKKGRDW